MELTSTQMWQAVSERNCAFDGQFVYAVKTTGIFCRPTCPSRRPSPNNVHFYKSTEAAKLDGYRACLRCRPEAQQSTSEAIVEKVERQIAANPDSTPRLAELGALVGLSPSHLQKLFKAARGISPSQYARELRLQKLKENLTKMTSVTEALFESGYSSTSRLYEQGKSALGMTPGDYKKGGKGLTIAFTGYESPLGPILLAATREGLCFLQFGEFAELRLALEEEFPQADLEENSQQLNNWTAALDQYFAGQADSLQLPVHMTGTEFQKTVWRYLRTIGAGETRSYSEVAKGLGAPQAVRAVAKACATNKVALAIPCHRVVKQDGGLAGFRWGLERKQALLQKESRAAKAEAIKEK